MTEPGLHLTARAAWKALEIHYARMRDVHLRQLFAEATRLGRRARIVDNSAGLLGGIALWKSEAGAGQMMLAPPASN